MNILFICTGNSCRSPMAEFIARDVFRRAGVEAQFASAGVSVLMSMPASENAAAVCDERGFDMNGFRTRQVTAVDVGWADLILTMTRRHKAYMNLHMTKDTDKLYTLGEYLGEPEMEISDPFGGTLEMYKKCAGELEQAITRLSDIISRQATASQNHMAKSKPAIAIGSDHAGYELKTRLAEYLSEWGWGYKDFGAFGQESTDYPLYADMVTAALLSGEYRFGVLLCGTGIGISMAANRHKGIRCAICHDVFSAKATREHNDANILAMGGRVIGIGHAAEILKAFLETDFSGDEKYIRRIGMFDKEN